LHADAQRGGVVDDFAVAVIRKHNNIENWKEIIHKNLIPLLNPDLRKVLEDITMVSDKCEDKISNLVKEWNFFQFEWWYRLGLYHDLSFPDLNEFDIFKDSIMWSWLLIRPVNKNMMMTLLDMEPHKRAIFGLLQLNEAKQILGYKDKLTSCRLQLPCSIFRYSSNINIMEE
jgi:hypothetical protein